MRSEIGMKPRLARTLSDYHPFDANDAYSETVPKTREAFLPVFIVCSQDAARSRAA